MSLDALFSKLKGSSSSGNYGHAGIPGHYGGSAPGGGHSAIGIKPGSDVKKIISDRKSGKKEPVAEEVNYQTVTPEIMSGYYKMDELCAQKPCDSLVKYSDEDDEPNYSHINSFLRFNDGDSNTLSKPIKDIDELIEKGPRAPNNMLVKRAIGSKELFDQLEPGGTFTDKGFVSTTINPRADKMVFGDYTVNIKVPKGSKGLFLEDITVVKKENEFLLPRGSKFRVLSKTGKEVEVELYNG